MSPGALTVFAVLVLGVGCASSGAIFVRLADAPALSVAAYRLGLATLVLLPAAALGKSDTTQPLDRRATLGVLAAGAALAAHFGLWIASLDYTSVASSVALVTTHPVLVGLAAPVVLKERVGPVLAAGIVVALVGAFAIVAGDAGRPGLTGGHSAATGDFLALGGAAAFGLYVMAGRRLRQRLPLLQYVTWVYGAAAVLLVGAAVATGAQLTGFETGTWAALIGIAVIPQIVGHSSLNWALQHVSATFVSASVLGEIAGSTLLAWLVLGERAPTSSLVGAALIGAGLLIAGLGERRRRRRHTQPES